MAWQGSIKMSEPLKLIMFREGGSLFPADEASANDFQNIPRKPKLVRVTVTQPRNPAHHRLYRLLLQKIAATDSEFSTPEQAHDWIRLRLRMFKEFREYDGRFVVVLDSTDCTSMDQLAFKSFYDKAMAAFAERIGVDPESLLDARP